MNDVEDTSRVVQKFVLGRGNVGDLSSIYLTIKVWTSIKERIEQERAIEWAKLENPLSDEWAGVDALLERMTDLGPLATRIAFALVDQQSEAGSEETLDHLDDDAVESHEMVISFASAHWKIKPKYDYFFT